MHSANTELEKAIKQKKSRKEAEDDAAEKLGLHLTPLWELRRQLRTQFEKEFAPPVMVATDIAARGLDFDCKVDLVINYDFPYNSIDYLHRTGRTARAGQSGKIVSLISKYDTNLATQIQDAIKRDLPFDTIGSDHYLLERRERERLMEASQKTKAGAGEEGRGKGESENKGVDERNSNKAGGDQRELISADMGAAAAAAAVPLMGARKVAGDRSRGGAVASKRSETANKREKDVANDRSADAEYNDDNRGQVQNRKATEPKTRGRAKAENDKMNRKNWDRKMWAPMTAAIEAAAAMVKEKPQPYSRRERFSEAGKEDNGGSR
uniref:Helicase C-terminal domain-containing protein n=1 Tax=Polytomella parva TaxID=51329 RepID=A0A7S0YTN6_9CHLO|mmetsp:Transcript_8689/g.16507  ORF Transcript_8689/g.16507 Transcript_8689/m.16507 type:complete len:323 (+) Transcript_8689:387-1355(+)